ncbi:MAG: dihydrodipicolinate synthase family protein [Acidobacteriota bacterium]
MNKNLSGIFPPVTTPFDTDGELLIDRFKENLVRWAATPLAGLTVLGSNGEAHFLSDQERLLLVREARLSVDSSRTMVVGAGKESTRLTVDFTRKVADLGADYALVGIPCYYRARMTDDALFAHFWSVADESPIPILIYNAPQFTGMSASAALIERLSAHENIAGMKESAGSLPLQAEVRRRTADRFQILVGSAPTLFPSLVQGACGGIVAIACALPAQMTELYETFRSGNWKGAAELQKRLSPPAEAVTALYGIPGLKYAMSLMGFFGGEARLPLLPLKEDQKTKLTSILREAGLLDAAELISH